MSQTTDDDVRVVARQQAGVQRSASEDFMAGERHQHGVLDIVVERIAVADAFQRDAGDRRNELDQRFGGAKPPLHILSEEAAEGVGGEFWHGDHDSLRPFGLARSKSVSRLYPGWMTGSTTATLPISSPPRRPS
jgi:hypothetical protein